MTLQRSLFLAAFLVCVSPQTVAQVSTSNVPARITARVDDSRLLRLTGSTHPAVLQSQDLGPVEANLPMDRMQLVLRRGPEQQEALDAFLEAQVTPHSPDFHQWLSPVEFGQRFGVSDADLAIIEQWLTAQGFQIGGASHGRISLEFSGTAEQVEHAFHTEIHRFRYKGATHIANRSDPSIPEALGPVVVGVQSLHDFRATGQARFGGKVSRDERTGKYTRAAGPSVASLVPLSGGTSIFSPQYRGTINNTTANYLAPYDFAAVYNETPLWNAGNNGAGVHIAISGGSDISMSDVAAFRSQFGLPVNPPTVIHNGTDPGSSADVAENTLDVEWAGAAAPGAKIDLVVSANTATTEGFQLSAQYIVENQVAPIMSSSYGECELALGTAGNAFWNQLWQQAAAEGISAFVSSGDQDSAGCDYQEQTTPFVSLKGLAVNGLASSPYITAVGGTDFGYAEFSAPSNYFNTTNAANGQSAKGYIPEVPWNNSCTSTVASSALGIPGYTAEQACNAEYNAGYYFLINTAGGSGGKSACTAPTGTTPGTCAGGYAKPSWQAGSGVPADGKRDLPDISLFAANGEFDSAYVFYYNGGLNAAGGTSISSPAMAGIMSLIVQSQGTPQGLANPVFYSLASQQTPSSCNSDTVTAGNSCYFYDVVDSNNATPCGPGSPDCTVATAGDQIGTLNGYNSTTGYDLATGLGTANAANLVAGWHTIVGTQAVTITLSPASLPAGALGTAYSQQIMASGGIAPYTYTVTSGALPVGLALSGDGYLTGVPTVLGTFSFTVTASDRSAAGPFTGSVSYTVLVGPSVNTGMISWNPARDTTYTGIALGTDVLDATSTNGGTITYTATLRNADPVAVTAATILAPGVYTLTANNSVAGTLSIPFKVLAEYVWIANSAGSLFRLDAAGNSTYVMTGGGHGLAIDSGGTGWSATTSGTAIGEFSNSSSTSAVGAVSGGGLNGAVAVAIDGAGSIWVANSSNSVSEFTNLGIALSPASGYTGGAMNTPTGIAVDISGSVWISNAGNSSVTQILGGAVPVEPLANAVTLNTPAVKP